MTFPAFSKVQTGFYAECKAETCANNYADADTLAQAKRWAVEHYEHTRHRVEVVETRLWDYDESIL